MISDQIGIRDGLHLLKVRSSLCLEPYLIAAVSTEEADPEGEVEVWTPKRFFEASTRYFQEKIVPEG